MQLLITRCRLPVQALIDALFMANLKAVLLKNNNYLIASSFHLSMYKFSSVNKIFILPFLSSNKFIYFALTHDSEFVFNQKMRTAHHLEIITSYHKL